MTSTSLTSSSSSSSPPPIDWKFSQVFGERLPSEELQDADIISAVEFERSGNYLAVGDKGGRVVIFDRHDGKDRLNREVYRSELERVDFPLVGTPEYQYRTEFQSHEPEFDYLKSLEIEEKINKIRWCPTQNGSLFILSTNDKTIKLWKIKERKVKKRKELDPNPAVYSESSLFSERSYMSVDDPPLIANGHHMESTDRSYEEEDSKIAYVGDSSRASCRKVFAHAHDFNINSISNNSDGETFVSADDLRINLWNLEISDQCFNIIDMKPSNMEDLTEVITSAEFHPIHCNILAYSSSRGFIRLVDLRQSAICDHNAKILQDAENHGSKSFFTEIIASISDIKFTNDAKHILSRDYLNLKLWDIRMDSSPVAVFKIHEHLRPKLCDLYNNDTIFDKFECCVSGDGLNFATGSYSNLLRIFSHGVGNEEGITVEATKNPNRKPLLRSSSRARRSSLSNLTRGFLWQGHENSNTGGSELSFDLSSKMRHLAWHPNMNFIACASGNSLFMYHA